MAARGVVNQSTPGRCQGSRAAPLWTTLPIAHFTPQTHTSLARALLYFADDDERLEREHRQGQVLAVINFQRLADNLRLFIKTAKAGWFT